MLIRRATDKDLSAIIRLFVEDNLGSQREVFSDPLLPSYFKAFEEIQKDPNSELMVAEHDGQILGTFQMTFITYLTFQGSKVAQIESVHIDSKKRGLGLGTQLMKWAIERARQVGCQRIQLTSNKIRKDAHRFYERLGFNSSHEGMKLFLDLDKSETQ